MSKAKKILNEGNFDNVEDNERRGQEIDDFMNSKPIGEVDTFPALLW